MHRLRFYSSFAALALGACSFISAQALRLDELKITTYGNKQSREFSFSDKHAGFFYGMTGTDDFLDWNAGWNIRARRVFTDYRLYCNGRLLPRQHNETTVNIYPDRMVRRYPGFIKETFSLVDEQKVIYIALENRGKKEQIFGIELLGDIISKPSVDGNTAILTPKEHQGNVVRVAAINPDVPVTAIALAAQDSGGFTARPVTPCGSCRQVLAEMESRFHRPITVLMYGASGIWRTAGVVNLLPLAFDSIPSQESQV